MVSRRSLVLVAAAGAVLGLVAVASGSQVGPQEHVTANGRHLTPAGRVTTVGNFPSGGALTPDGKQYWAVDSGHGRDDVTLVDIASGRVLQSLPLPGAYGGIAFNPTGTRAYVSGEPIGDSVPAGKTVAKSGDAVHVFAIGRSGTAHELSPIQLPATSGGTAQQTNANPAGGILYTPPGPGPSSGLGWPIGLAVSGTTLVCALNQADQVALVDLARRTTRLVKVGAYPFGVAVSGHRAYVTNEYDGTVSVLDVPTGKVVTTTPVGAKNSHPEGITVAGSSVYVAVTNSDHVARLGLSGTLEQSYSVGRAGLTGTAPTAVAVAADRLYAADSGEDALAVVDLRSGRVAGRIPTAAYPTGVAVTRQRQLVWLAAKGLGAGPNPAYGRHFANSDAAPYGSYVPDKLLGKLGVLPVPGSGELARYTRQADQQVRPADLTARPSDTVVSSPGGGPSQQIKHVFLIVRENRTYDQVFGRDPRGDGDPRLELFGDNGTPGPSGGITPNAHALSRRFPLLDNVYADSEVSVDGHQITSGSYATDFVQRALHASYSGRGRAANIGSDPVTLPPNDYVFDQAVRQGVTFHNYGETNSGNLPAADDGRSTFLPSGLGTSYTYPLFFGCGAAPSPATRDVVCSTDSGTVGTGTRLTSSRFDFFQASLKAQIATGTVPALSYLTLPNDHTNGVQKGYPTPAALVADNDLGLGQVVDLISHSSIWPSSAIFVMEDDSQDGADHVDAHRMPGFVISPWARTGAVIHTRYDQLSMLRTAELMVGLHPLSLFDGLAAPMYDVFRPAATAPDLRPYTAVTPAQDLQAVTTTTPTGIDAALPYDVRDLVPQSLFDAALWRSVYGAHSTPPPPGPDASPDEASRARAALDAFRSGLDVRLWLTSSERR